MAHQVRKLGRVGLLVAGIGTMLVRVVAFG
jgi:hypothetical protein